MASISFTADIKIRGINPYVLVSAERAERIKAGWRKPLPVIVRINGKPADPWHINLMPVGDGDFYLYLHETVRKASGTRVGDEVTVEVGFDASYQGGPSALPIWFSKALGDNPVARGNWEKLSPSRQKEIIRYFANLKSAEAQERNLLRAMQALSGGDDRFMGRSWSDGA